MKRRIVCVLFLIFCLCLSGCDGPHTLTDHLESRDTRFFVMGADLEAQLDELYKSRPAMQIYIKQITVKPRLFYSDVEVVYDGADVPESAVGVAETEEELADVMERQFEGCPETGVIVYVGHRDDEPDIAALRERIKEEHYLSTMGITAIKCSFGHNSFTDDLIIEYTLEYMDAPARIEACRERVRGEIERLSAELYRRDDEPVSVVRSIHDYLIENASYDQQDDSLLIGHTPYGVLFEGRGVCDGYTYAAKLLLDAAGIENRIVEGSADGGDHIWNLVRLGDRFYHMDVTWDDPVDRTGKAHLLYDYFLVGDEQIAADHEWDRNSVPSAPENF